MSGEVEVDTSELQAAMRRLSASLTAGGSTVAQRQATTTAGAIRAATPVRTGRLAATIGVTPVDGGFGVTYGGGLRYARPVAKRTHAIANAAAAAPEQYAGAQYAMARAAANRL